MKEPVKYKGHTIIEIFRYHMGRSDFEVCKDEKVSLHPNTCIEDIKREIDEMEDNDLTEFPPLTPSRIKVPPKPEYKWMNPKI